VLVVLDLEWGTESGDAYFIFSICHCNSKIVCGPNVTKDSSLSCIYCNSRYDMY
jgi:hypothetical protein